MGSQRALPVRRDEVDEFSIVRVEAAWWSHGKVFTFSSARGENVWKHGETRIGNSPSSFLRESDRWNRTPRIG